MDHAARSPRITGLDPALRRFGIAVTWNGDVETAVIRPADTLTGHERLEWLLATVEPFVTDADLVVIEGPSYRSASNGQTGHHERAGLWWLITHGLLWRQAIRHVVIDPARLQKYATGSGNCGKDRVSMAAARRFPSVPLETNDAADALWLAAMAADFYGFPMTQMPEAQRAVLTARSRSGGPPPAWPALAVADATGIR